MNGCYPVITVKVRMNNGNIAEANNPFGMCGQLTEIQFIYNAYSTVTTTCTHDGFNGVVVQHLLKICRPFFICAAKSKIAFADGIAYPDSKTPALHLLYGVLYFLECNVTGATGYTNCITGLQVPRNDKRFFCVIII